MDIITKYFPNLTERQREQFAALLPLYEEWNAQINVISRKDMEHFYEHHVLHSLAIAKVVQFRCRLFLFNPLPPCGGRLYNIVFPSSIVRFQSTPSVRRETQVFRGARN